MKYLKSDYIKIGLLLSILVTLLVINHNVRYFGRFCTQSNIENTNLQTPQKAQITKNKGILIGDFPPCLTVTAFVDYECVFCKRFMQEVFPKIRENYINEGKLSFEFRNLPLQMHENALNLAKASICSSEKFKFDDFSKKIFNTTETMSDTNLMKLLSEIGITQSDFDKCKNDTSINNKIEFDINECKKNGINGTPTFVINDNVYVGLIPYEDFKKIIDKEIGKNPKNNSCH